MGRPGLTQHMKFKRLARSLGSPMLARGALELLWEPAYECGDDYVGTVDDIEGFLDWKGETGALTRALLEAGGSNHAGFIEPVAGASAKTGPYRIHDLFHHAPNYVSARRQYESERRHRKSCKHCGTIYHSGNPKRQYCTDRCRKYHSRYHGSQVVTDSDGDDRHTPSQEATVTVCDDSVQKGVTDDGVFNVENEQNDQQNRGVSRSVTIVPRTPAPAPVRTDHKNDLYVGSVTLNAHAAGTPDVPHAEDALLTFPVSAGKIKKAKKGKTKPKPRPTTWVLTQARVDEWAEAFDTLDILAESKQALAWVKANPSHKKTYDGMPAFLTAWFARSVRMGRPRGATVITGSLRTAGNKAAIGSFVQRRWGDGVDES